MQQDTAIWVQDALRCGKDSSEHSGNLTTNLGVRSSNLFGRAISVQNWTHQKPPFLRLKRRRACAAARFSRSQRWMISAGYGRRGRPAQALTRACTASRWYPSTWFSNSTEMLHDSRLLSAYLSVASAAKES